MHLGPARLGVGEPPADRVDLEGVGLRRDGAHHLVGAGVADTDAGVVAFGEPVLAQPHRVQAATGHWDLDHRCRGHVPHLHDPLVSVTPQDPGAGRAGPGHVGHQHLDVPQ